MEELYFLDISSLLPFRVRILSLSPSSLPPLPTHMHAHARTRTHARTTMAVLEQPQKDREMQTLYTPALPPESRFLKPKPGGEEMGNIPSTRSSPQVL